MNAKKSHEAMAAELREQVDRLRTLPAVQADLAAADQADGEKRRRVLDVLDAAERHHAETLPRLRAASDRTTAALRAALQKLREAQYAHALAEQAIGDADRALEGARRQAARELGPLGEDEIERLIAGLNIELINARAGVELAEQRDPYGKVTGYVDRRPEITAHIRAVEQHIAAAKSLRLSRSTPGELRRRIDEIRTAARLGAAAGYHRTGVLVPIE